jgi:Trypsin
VLTGTNLSVTCEFGFVISIFCSLSRALEAYVLLGSHYNDLELEEPNRRIYISETFVIHPDWNDETLAGDVALIKLPDPISFDG